MKGKINTDAHFDKSAGCLKLLPHQKLQVKSFFQRGDHNDM